MKALRLQKINTLESGNQYLDEEFLDELNERFHVEARSLTNLHRSVPRGMKLEYVLSYQGRFSDVEQYKNVILKANPNGESLHLKDVANVELGSEFYDIYSNLNQYPSAAIVLNLGNSASK